MIPLVLYLVALKITLFSSCDLHVKDDTISSSIANATSAITSYHCRASFSMHSNGRSQLSPKTACTAVPGTSQISPVIQAQENDAPSLCLLQDTFSVIKDCISRDSGLETQLAIFSLIPYAHHSNFPFKSVTITFVNKMFSVLPHPVEVSSLNFKERERFFTYNPTAPGELLWVTRFH